MTATNYELVETFDITRVHPERDTIQDLYDAAEFHNDGDSTWSVIGGCVEFRRPTGSTLTPFTGVQETV